MGMFTQKINNKEETILPTTSKNIAVIVLGKFLSAVAVILITFAFSLIYYIILCIFAGKITNIQTVLTTLIGFLLVSMSYISFGMLISSLTKNQIVAGVVTAILIALSSYLPNISLMFSIISPAYLFQKYPYGIIATTESITLILQTLMFITITILLINKRKIQK